MKKVIAFLLAMVFIAGTTQADAAQKTDWAKLRVGQMAYLGSFLLDDNDISQRPICTSYTQLVATEQPDGKNCPHSRRVGTLVVVTDIGPSAQNKLWPTVGIRSSNGAWTGWVESITLQPIIPVGTRLVFTKTGDANVTILRSSGNDAQMKEGGGINIGSPVAAVVLRQDPPSGACDLLIRVLSGPKAGMTGWTCGNAIVEGTKIHADTLE